MVKSDGEVGFVYTHFTNTPEASPHSQPVVSGNARYTFLFDGRIDNRADMAAWLTVDPGRLTRMSDAALAMAAWEKAGTDGLNQWVGEFAAIVWDREKREASLIRDHFGRRPLHYNLTDKRLIVSSMPKGIHALGDIPRELDRTRLTDVLTQFDFNLTRSYYRHLDLVAPASVLRVNRDSYHSTKYYALRDHIKPIRYANDDDYVEAAQELFDTSMEACLRSPGKVGSHLSAGMDSSLIAAHAAQRLNETGQRLATYTWVPHDDFDETPPPGICYDESPAAQAMAEMYPNIDSHFVGSDGPGLYDGLKEYFLTAESVIRNMLNVSLLMANGRMARADGVKVLLSGGNGNLTFSYNGISAPYDLLRQGKLPSMLREIHGHNDPSGEWRRLLLSVLPQDFVTFIRKIKNPTNTLEHEILRRSAALPTATQSRKAAERAKEENYDFHLRAVKNDRDQWITYIENYSGPVEANLLAAAPALFGHEMRDPFMNRKILEWCFGVPSTQFRRSGKGRFLMRRLMQGKTPSVIANQEFGMGHQSADWVMRVKPELDRMQRDLIAGSRLESVSDIIDVNKVEQLIEKFPQSSKGLKIDQVNDYLVTLPLAISISALAVDNAGLNSN